MEKVNDEEEELSTAEALCSIGILLIVCVLTYYTFAVLSETSLGWAMLIALGVVGWVLFVSLNRKYRWVVLRRRPPEEGEYSTF
nr:MAG: hypothetical protein AM324_15565 [Candidatus Thorarchaeota archaeon SMTZ1-83]